MMLKDGIPHGTDYLLLRDTVSGGQPTCWQFWSLSEKLGTPDDMRDLTAYLADKPGKQAAPARELHGNRFTAVGQYDVDLEYFIAQPTTTPRYTLHYGEPNNEYQDLLRLELPGDGYYYVVLFPRLRTEAPPSFATLDERGTIIKVAGDFGTDYNFLSAEEMTASAAEVSFRGKAGSVQDRRSGLVLALGGPGELHYRTSRLVSVIPVSLRVNPATLTFHFPADQQGGQVQFTLPGKWKIAGAPDGCTLTRDAGGVYTLTVMPHVLSLSLAAN